MLRFNFKNLKVDSNLTPKPMSKLIKIDHQHQQWVSADGIDYFPATTAYNELEPGLYEPSFCPSRGYYCKKLSCKTDDLFRFPNGVADKIVDEIGRFWELEVKYRENNLAYKRGVICWSSPGFGKSSTIKLVLKDVFERGGIALKFEDPEYFKAVVRLFRNIQPNTPLVVLLEDIDTIIEDWGETEVLNIIDGVESIDKAVFLATTNYPEKLGDRIINRPSRFDRRYKMSPPNKTERKLYLEYLNTTSNFDFDIEKWINDTKGFSIAHLKELFVAVNVFGDEYKEILCLLTKMNEDKISSKDDEESIGFYQGSK